MKRIIKLYFVFAVLVFFGCKESYTPVVTTVNSNILVVEGFINIGGDSTIFKVGRTVTIANGTTLNPERGASVAIQSDANETYALSEKQSGTYVMLPLILDPSRKYRLSIKTAKGQSYLSEFVEAKISAPIDSISWAAKTNSLEVYVNTHDVTNKTRYYRWEYSDTWIFYSKYLSSLVWGPNGIGIRNMETNNIYKCWANGISNRIVLGSTAKLTNDVVSQGLLTTIPSNSEKLIDKYSILVKQYALTKEAFEFWENLKKNTESLGSIFDAQPSQLTGNIHNVANVTEPVIGYVGAGSTEKKRIFISKSQLPLWRPAPSFDCKPDTVPLNLVQQYFGTDGFIPVSEVFNEGGTIIGYTTSTIKCIDCTLRGTNKQPAFWQ